MNAGAIAVLVILGVTVALCALVAAGVSLSRVVPRVFRRPTFQETMERDPIFREFKESGAKFNDPVPERTDYRYRNFRDAS